MSAPGNVSPVLAGQCWFGNRKLPVLLEAFTSETGGVKEGRDIEYIHRMRVASRRLRAALPLFVACFPEKQYARWMDEISRVTRALGNARDADVQIAFLQKSLRSRKKNRRKNDRGTGNAISREPALSFLLESLRARRAILQDRVLAAIRRLERSGITDEMRLSFAAIDAGFRATRKKPGLQGIAPRSALRIGRRLSVLLSYERWVSHPEAVAEHHATRIAAKKLRYTMEVFGPVYRNNLGKPLARVKRLQEILGDLHDCDVWIDQITALLLRERTLLRSGKGTKRPDTTTLASLRLLLREREAGRKRLYRRFVRYWQALRRAGIWEELVTTLDAGRKNSFRPVLPYRDDDADSAVQALAASSPAAGPHPRKVTDIALGLFDSLQDLHGLGPHDRLLLGRAARLHDTGRKTGKPENTRRVAETVFTSELIPFDLKERALLAMIIFLLRRKNRRSSCPYSMFLSPGDRKKALVLAEVLRLADTFDYRQSGAVSTIGCHIAPGAVTCTVTGTGDITQEKEHARAGADLFGQVFDRVLVVR